MPWSPDQFASFVNAELAKWAKVVKEAGIRVD
jgi:tripartite-type tricarboxylate transporter receptor subunit TctC